MEHPSAGDTAVLDTNVVLDWLVFRDPRAVPLAAAITQGRLRWLASARMRAELDTVLQRTLPAWGPRWQADRDAALAAFARHAGVRDEPPACPLACTDASDQMFIDLAWAARSRWLLTRDRALLRLARRARAAGIAIVPPERWLPAQRST